MPLCLSLFLSLMHLCLSLFLSLMHLCHSLFLSLCLSTFLSSCLCASLSFSLPVYASLSFSLPVYDSLSFSLPVSMTLCVSLFLSLWLCLSLLRSLCLCVFIFYVRIKFYNIGPWSTLSLNVPRWWEKLIRWNRLSETGNPVNPTKTRWSVSRWISWCRGYKTFLFVNGAK